MVHMTKVIFNLVSLKKKHTIDQIDPTQVTLGQIKNFLWEEFGIPVKAQKLIEGGKVIKCSDDCTMDQRHVSHDSQVSPRTLTKKTLTTSLKRQASKKSEQLPNKSGVIQITVMGQVAKEAQLKELTITDIISFIFSFLTMREVRLCQCVSRDWNRLAIQGTNQSPDRYCVLSDKKTIYDMLLHRNVHRLEHPILHWSLLYQQLDSIYTHRNLVNMKFTTLQLGENNMQSDETNVPSLVYTGIRYLFQIVEANSRFDSTRVQYLVCLHAMTGHEKWRVPVDQLKPIEMVNKQQHYKRYLRRNRRQDDLSEDEVSDDEMGGESDDEDSVPENVNDRRANEDYQDNHMMTWYDVSSNHVFVQYDTYVIVLNGESGERISFIDPDDIYSVLNLNREDEQADIVESRLTKFTARMIILGPIIALAVKDFIYLYNKYTLYPVSILDTQASTIHSFKYALEVFCPGEFAHNELRLLVQQSDSKHAIFDHKLQQFTAKFDGNPLVVTNSNIMTSDLSVYDVEEGELLFKSSLFTSDEELRDSEVFGFHETYNSHYFDGYYAASLATQEKISDSFAASLPLESLRSRLIEKPTSIDLVAIKREYIEEYEGPVGRKKLVLKQNVLPALVWSTVIWIPQGITRHYVQHADRLFIAACYSLSLEYQHLERRQLINGVYEREHSDELEMNEQLHRLVVYSLDAQTGAKKWLSEMLVPKNEQLNHFSLKSGCLFLCLKDANITRQVVLSAMSGVIQSSQHLQCK